MSCVCSQIFLQLVHEIVDRQIESIFMAALLLAGPRINDADVWEDFDVVKHLVSMAVGVVDRHLPEDEELLQHVPQAVVRPDVAVQHLAAEVLVVLDVDDKPAVLLLGEVARRLEGAAEAYLDGRAEQLAQAARHPLAGDDRRRLSQRRKLDAIVLGGRGRRGRRDAERAIRVVAALAAIQLAADGRLDLRLLQPPLQLEVAQRADGARSLGPFFAQPEIVLLGQDHLLALRRNRGADALLAIGRQEGGLVRRGRRRGDRFGARAVQGRNAVAGGQAVVVGAVRYPLQVEVDRLLQVVAVDVERQLRRLVVQT